MTTSAFFGSIGFALVLYGVWRWLRIAEIRSWPKVSGCIEQLKEEERAHSQDGMTGRYYVPKIEVSYRINGVQYRTDRSSVHNFTIGFPGEARELLKGAVPGSSIDVHYDPSAPERSIVTNPSQVGAGMALFLGATVIVRTALVALP